MGFLSSVIKGGLSTGIGAVSGGLVNGSKLFDDFSGKYQQNDANAAAMRAWQLQNDYNSPVAQMERLKLAGLNPLLVYGSGSVAGNTTSSPNLVGGTTLTGAQSAFKGLTQMLQIAQGQAAVDQATSSAQASRAAAGASGAQAANLSAQTAINETRSKYEQKSLIADIDYKQALADKTRAEASIAQGEAEIFGSVGGSKGASAAATGFGKAAKFFRGLIK